MNAGVIRKHILILLLFLILTAVMTYPAAFQMSSHIIGDGFDGYMNCWNLWWVKTALMDLERNPYYTQFLFYPQGVSLLLHTLNPFNGIISIPFQYFFSLSACYNAVVLLSFVLSGYFMFLLAAHLTGDLLASFAAGFIFTFCPYHFAHGLGHLQLIAMEWVPLYVLCLIKMINEAKIRNAVFASICCLLVAACDWYYLFFCFMLSVLVLLFSLVTKGPSILTKGFFQRSAVFVCLGPLVCMLFIMPMLKEASRGTMLGSHDVVQNSANLLSYFTPSWMNPIWGTYIKHHIQGAGGFLAGSTEGLVFIGYSLLAFLAWSWRYAKRSPAFIFWMLASLLSLVFSLGPRLQAGSVNISLPLMPYQLLSTMFPFLELGGAVSRFSFLVMFCLGLSCAISIKAMRQNCSEKRLAALVPLLMLALLTIEYLPAPFTTTKLHVPAFYAQVKKEKGDFAILELPFDPALTAEAMFFQTQHHRYLSVGYISRISKEKYSQLENDPLFGLFLHASKMAELDITGIRASIAIHKIRYIVDKEDGYHHLLKERLGLKQVYAAGSFVVYSTAETTSCLRSPAHTSPA